MLCFQTTLLIGFFIFMKKFKLRDKVKHSYGIGFIWKITEKTIHVRNFGREEGRFMYIVFHFNPSHHTQSHVNELQKIRKTTFEKLSDRIFKDTGYNLFCFERTYASRDWLASGRLSWHALAVENKCDSLRRNYTMKCGSPVNATDLINQKEKIEIHYHRNLMPEFF